MAHDKGGMEEENKRKIESGSVDIPSLREGLREKLLKIYQKDRGYDIFLWSVDFELLGNLDYLLQNFPHTHPIMIKDKSNKIWIYGLNEKGEHKLTDLILTEEEVKKYDEVFKKIGTETFMKLNSSDIPAFVYDDIISKSGHIQEIHFEHFPKEIFGRSDRERETVEKMRRFILSDEAVDKLLQEFLDLARVFSDGDLNSLGTAKETPNAKRYRNIFVTLEENGIYATRGEKISFWSGWDAFDKASNVPGEVSTLKVPTTQFMFCLSDLLDDRKIEIPDNLRMAVARIYASRAQGDVNVYISSGKPSERPSLKVNNFFWSAELPMLQQKLQRGEVSSIQIHLYNKDRLIWEEPVDINSKRADVLPVIRRNAYQPDIEKLRTKVSAEFMKKIVEMAEIGEKAAPFEGGAGSSQEEDLEKTKARHPISLGKLKKILKHWEDQTGKSVLKRLQQKDPKKEDVKVQSEIVQRTQKHFLHMLKKKTDKEVQEDKPFLSEAQISVLIKEINELPAHTSYSTLLDILVRHLTPILPEAIKIRLNGTEDEAIRKLVKDAVSRSIPSVSLSPESSIDTERAYILRLLAAPKIQREFIEKFIPRLEFNIEFSDTRNRRP